MTVGDLMAKLETLVMKGDITYDTNVYVTSDPDQDYDRTTQIVLRKTARRELLLVDKNSEIWGNKAL